MTEKRMKMLMEFAQPESLIPQNVKPLFDVWLRDTHIILARDGYYYCTGTTRAPGTENAKLYNDGIRMWRSPDLRQWEDMGLVWSFEKDATWQNRWYAPVAAAGNVSLFRIRLTARSMRRRSIRSMVSFTLPQA